MASNFLDIVRGFPARLRVDGAGKQSMEIARHRLVVGGLLFAVCFAVVAVRLVDVTLMSEAREPRQARVPHTGPLDLSRADIVDRNGVLLATSLVTQSLYANPRLIADPAGLAQVPHILTHLRHDAAEFVPRDQRQAIRGIVALEDVDIRPANPRPRDADQRIVPPDGRDLHEPDVEPLRFDQNRRAHPRHHALTSPCATWSGRSSLRWPR